MARVLVIDDEPDVRLAGAGVLACACYEAVAAPDAALDLPSAP